MDPVRSECFPPVVAPGTRLLILGSLPGAASLAAGRYYANPRNRFWHLVGDVIGLRVETLSYEDRLMALADAGIGLWDSIGSAERQGSLDAAIRRAEANPLAALAASLPMLEAIAFNGAKSAAVGRRALGATGLALYDLPSSSPASTLPYATKLAAWVRLRPHVASTSLPGASAQAERSSSQ